jgi:hypothetical protein
MFHFLRVVEPPKGVYSDEEILTRILNEVRAIKSSSKKLIKKVKAK